MSKRLFKVLAVPAIGVAFCFATVASAQNQPAPTATAPAKPKPRHRKPVPAPPPVPALPPQTLNCGVEAGAPCTTTCEPGAGTNADGSCVTKAQSVAIRATRLRADAAVAIKTNDNGPPNILPDGIGTTGSGATDGGGIPTAAQIDVYWHGSFSPGSPSAGGVSDARAKRDITPLEILDNGVMLYSFRYFWSDQVYVGVMAQQVASIDPAAVETMPGGYYWVRYDRLGLKMQTWQEWQAGQGKRELASP